MKRILIVIMALTLFLSTNNIVSFADEPTGYQLEVSVFDVNGKPLDLTYASLQIQSGGSNYTRIIASPNTNEYENRSYYVTSAMKVEINFNKLSIYSEVSSDVNIMISNDMSDYHYHLEEIIPLSKLDKTKPLHVNYYINQLDKIELNMSTDSKSDDNLTYYLFKNANFDKGRREDVRSSGTAQQSVDKTFYVSKGTYEVSLVSITDDQMYVYRENNIYSSTNRTVIKADESLYRTYQLFQKKLYDNHERMKLYSMLSGNDYIIRYFDLNYENPLTLKCYDPKGESVSVHLFKPDSIAVSENMRLSPLIKVTDNAYPNSIVLYPEEENYRLKITRQNSSSLNRFIDKQYFINGVTLEFYDLQTKELVLSNTYYTDVVPFVYPEVKDKAYEVKVIFSNYLLPAYFLSSYDSENGSYKFTFVESERNRSKLSAEDVSTSIHNDKFTFSLNAINESNEVTDYKLFLANKVDIEKRTLLLNSYNIGKLSIDCLKSVLIENTDTKLIVQKNDKELLSVPVVELISRDLAGHWAYDIMAPLLAKGDIYTRDATHYYPNEPVTRGEFSAFLSNALNLAMGNKKIEFSDITQNHPAYINIMIAASNGLISGKPNGTFDSSAAISRQDVTVIINNALKLNDIQVDDKVLDSKYTDISSISTYAIDSMRKCISAGILVGKTNTTINPKDMVTRAEAAVIISHVLDVINNKERNLNNDGNSNEAPPKMGNTNYNIATWGHVAFDDEWDYLLGDSTALAYYGYNGIYKVNKDRTESYQLTRESVSYINIDDEWLYFIQNPRYDSSYSNGFIYKMRKDGSDKTLLLRSDAYNLMVVDDYIYYTLDYPNSTLWRMNKNSGNQTLIGFKDVYRLQYNNGYIFYAEWLRDEGEITVYKVDENTFDREAIVEYEYNPKHSSFMYHIDGEWLYYLKNGDLFRVNTDGKNTTQLTKTFDIANYFVIDDKIYYKLYDINSVNINGYIDYHRIVYRMNKDGTNKVLIPYGSDLLYLDEPAGQTESKAFFWNGAYGLQIYEIKPDGTGRQAVLDYSITEVRNHLEINKPLSQYNQDILLRVIKKILNVDYMTIENTDDGIVHYRVHNERTGVNTDYYLDLEKGHLMDNEKNLYFDLSQFFDFK